MPARAPVLVAALLALVLAGCGGDRATARRPPQAYVATALQQVLAEARDRGGTGVAAAIVERGRLRWSSGAGFTDLRAGRPVDADTVFAIASDTKPFVSALVLRLAERGVLRLDDPVARWVPDAGVPRGVTLRRLLNHTAGLAEITEDEAWLRAIDRAPRRRWTPERTLGYVREPESTAGARWKYTNTGYLLAGLAIERAAGAPVADVLRDELLEPLGLTRTGLQPQDRPPSGAAHGHAFRLDAGEFRDVSRGMRWRPFDALGSAAWTAGGGFSTAAELARFGGALFGGRLLAHGSMRALSSWVPGVGLAPYLTYGLGVGQRLMPELGGELWGHTGHIPGFRADLWHVRSAGITVAVLANDERVDTTATADALLREVLSRRE